MCYHQADVKIVSVGGGFAYGMLGATHFATEDLGVMRMLPNLLVVAPGDPVETRHATRALVERPGPCYLRLGKAGEPIVHQNEIDFELGKAIRVRDGSDVTLMSTGGMLHNTVAAAEMLDAAGVHARVLSMHTLEPLDIEAVHSAAIDTGAIVTIEEHSIVGGLAVRWPRCSPRRTISTLGSTARCAFPLRSTGGHARVSTGGAWAESRADREQREGFRHQSDRLQPLELLEPGIGGVDQGVIVPVAGAGSHSIVSRRPSRSEVGRHPANQTRRFLESCCMWPFQRSVGNGTEPGIDRRSNQGAHARAPRCC